MSKASDKVLLEVNDLSVSFRQGGKVTEAVKRISFSIKKGETLALVGESGSGKSVSALSILKLLPYPAAEHPSGSVMFKGEDLLDSDESDLRKVRGNNITIIFQEPMTSLNPLHTIERQIGEVLQLHQAMNVEDARVKTLELLDQVGIHDAKERLAAFPHQLSGGQRQRVMIAMALANRPDLLIADEPTTALDVTVQAQILKLLKDLQREYGMAILMITHDLGIVRHFADKVCVMSEGKIVERGETAALFDNPQHDYTKMLLNAEPKGNPMPVNNDARVVMEAKDLKVWFPIKRGFFRKTVGHVKAVDGINVTVREGQTLGVVGESGSGKTTLGLAMLRLIHSEGKILYLGKNIEQFDAKTMRPLRKDIQIVFQDPYGSLSPRMSVRQIVEEGLLIQEPDLTYEQREKRVSDILEEVGVDPATMERYPHEFSGGQRQRIAIARAVILNPKFIMLDEPTSALDMSVQAQIVELLLKLQKAHNLSYVFISHDLRVVRALANHVIVMRAGNVVEYGEASQVFDNPREDYTKALLAAALNMEAPDEKLFN
ncbi:Prephenate dehydratase-associated ABC transporter, ATP-binding protein / Prephenate dehydratase-associated ABC transporter, ATP-binding protein [hydrothermal vent metagenome]|uniref:Prephenate dehydratase-associated ABC transporter, ATP-binding protein / Prephenate dehydratase-associated ABC transporter, ATP-binding protein n=1 Tax=hydrothermal vent metagenome TaxID=652676 RepID=A0A3B0T3A2_9ZZZZ